MHRNIFDAALAASAGEKVQLTRHNTNARLVPVVPSGREESPKGTDRFSSIRFSFPTRTGLLCCILEEAVAFCSTGIGLIPEAEL